MAKKLLNTKEDFKNWAAQQFGIQAAPATGAASANTGAGQTQAQQEQSVRNEALERLKGESQMEQPEDLEKEIDRHIRGKLFPGYENSDKSVLEQLADNAIQGFPSAMRTLREQIGGIFGGNGGQQQEQKPGTKYTFAGGNKAGAAQTEAPREYTGDEVNDAVKHIDELLGDKNLSWEDKIALQSDRNLLTDYAGGVVQHDAANNESVGAVIGRWGSRKAPETEMEAEEQTGFKYGSSLAADKKRLEALKAEREALISGDWSKGWLAASEMREADFQRLREIGPQINQLEQQVAEKEQDEEARRESARVNAMTDVERFLEGRMSQEEFNQLPESDRNEVMAMYHVYGEDGAQQVLNRLNEEKQVYTAMGLTAQEFSDLRPELREEALRTWREDASHAGFYSMLAREDWSYGSDVFKPGSRSAMADQEEIKKEAEAREQQTQAEAERAAEEKARADRAASMTVEDAREALEQVDGLIKDLTNPYDKGLLRRNGALQITGASLYTPYDLERINALEQTKAELERYVRGEVDFDGEAVAEIIDNQLPRMKEEAPKTAAYWERERAEAQAEKDKYEVGSPEYNEWGNKVMFASGNAEFYRDEEAKAKNPVGYFITHNAKKWTDDLLLAGLGPIEAMYGQYLRSLQAWGDLGQAAWDLTLGQIKQDRIDKDGNIRYGIPDVIRATTGYKSATDNPIYNAIDWMATKFEESAKKDAEQSVETWTQNLTEAGMKPEDAAYVADVAINKVGINVGSNIGAFLLSKGKREPMNPSNLGSVLKSPQFLTMWGVSWGRAIREDRAELGEKWNGIDFLFEGLSAGNEAGSELWDVADGNILYKIGRKVGLGDFGADLVKTNVMETSQELYQDFTGKGFKVGADWVNGREFRIDPALTVENMQKSGTLWSFADACDTSAMTFWNTTGMNVGNFALTHLFPAFSHPYTTSVMATLDGTATEDQKDLAAGVAIAAATIDAVAEQQEQKENGGAPTEEQQHDAFEEGLTGQGAPEDTVPAVNPMKVLDAQRKGRRKLQQPGGAADALRGAAEDAQKGKFLPAEQVQQIVEEQSGNKAGEKPGLPELPENDRDQYDREETNPQLQDVPVETGSQQDAQVVRDQEPAAEETALRKPTPAQQTAEMPEAPERLVRPMDASGTGEAMDALVAAVQARTGNQHLSPEEVQAAVAAAQGGMEQTAQAEETGKAAEKAAGAQAEVDQDEKLDTEVNEPQQGEQESDRLDTDVTQPEEKAAESDRLDTDVNEPREETDKLDTDVTEPRAEDQESDRLDTNVTDVPQGEAPEDQDAKLDTETSQAQEQAQADQNEKLETETGEPPEEKEQESEGAKLETETNQAQEQAQANADARSDTEINDVTAAASAQETTTGTQERSGSGSSGGGSTRTIVQTTATAQRTERTKADLEYDSSGIELMSSREKTAQMLNQAQGLSDDLRKAGAHFASWSGGTEMDAVTRQQVQVIDDAAKALGVSAVFDSEVGGGKANGSYAWTDENGHKVIHIAQNAKNPLQTVFSHEMLHLLAANNNQGYQDLKTAFLRYADNAGLDVGALVQTKMELYERHGVQLGGVDEETGYNADALEEVIADALYDVIGDERAARALAAKNPGLVQSIKNWIRDTLDKIHNLLNNYAERTPQAKMLRDQEGAMEELRRIMDEALTGTRPIREEKARVANVGSNGELTDKFQEAVREAEGREEMNKAASELADGILKGQGLEASLGNRQRLYTAAGDFMLSGGTISEAMELFDLKWTAGTAEQNRAFAALGKYVQGLMERNDVEGYQGLMEQEEAERDILSDSGEPLALDGGTTAKYSLRTWTDEEIERVRQNLIESGRFTDEQIDRWIEQVNSIAKYVADNKDRLDFEVNPDGSVRFLKPNGDYEVTLDASTLCEKRLLYQGIYNEIMKRIPNSALQPGDLTKLMNKLNELGLKAPCSFCYVESRRKWLGRYAKAWLKTYDGEYKPTLQEVTSTDGLARLKREHPQAAADFIKAMNKKGNNNPKVVQLRTDYDGDIRRLSPEKIEKIIRIGGLRVQSFSDFETVHLLDMVQAVLDMASMDLTAQAYTKVPAFARIFGGTGMKINLSLVPQGTGLDENGRLIFDDKEGIDSKEAFRIREMYSKDVGTILIGISDEQILAAMADPRIDFIIPFHRSGWSKTDIKLNDKVRNYQDYQNDQNERKFLRDENGRLKKKANGKYDTVKVDEGNFYPQDYWDYSKSGKENAEIYLKKCAEDGRLPKFYTFLVDNGDGSFSLQPDGSTDGYWKTLIDFKMYDNEGNPAPQRAVTPDINMDEAMRTMAEYDGNPNVLPYDEEVVDWFVKEYKKNHRREGPRWSISEDTETSARDQEYMEAVKSGDEAKQRRMVKEAAEAAGYDTSTPLFHGTQRFGFTEFNTDVIFATSSESVASGYGNIARQRKISERYVEDNGDPAGMAKNARNVLGTEVEPLNAENSKKVLAKYVDAFKEANQVVHDAMDNLPEDFYKEVPPAIETELWDVVGLFDYLLDDADGILDRSADERKEYLRGILVYDNPRESYDKLHNYYSEHREELKDTAFGKALQNLFKGYTVGDALIEYEYGFKKLMNGEAAFHFKNTGGLISRDELRNSIRAEAGKGIYKGFGRLGDNPLIVDARHNYWLNIPFEGKKASTDEIVNLAKKRGYTGVVIKDVMDPSVVNAYGDDYVFFGSDQFKSADPVTYDDNGKPIPLSERFNKGKEDIRYSITDEKENFALDEPVEETRDLVAVHNLNEAKLEKALEDGGLIGPSIAVMKKQTLGANNHYGDISIIFRRDTIDPDVSEGNRLYGADAWTPMYDSYHDYENPEDILDDMKRQPERGYEAGAEYVSGNLEDMDNAAAKIYRNVREMKDDSGRIQYDLFGNIKRNKQRLINEAKEMGFREEGQQTLVDIATLMTTRENLDLLKGEEPSEAAKRLIRRNLHSLRSDEEITKIYKLIRSFANLPTQYFEAKAMRVVKPEEWAAVVVPEKNRHLARVLKDAGIKVLTYSTEKGISTRSMVINEFAEQEHIKFSMMDQQEGDDTQQGRTAAEAEDEWNLYSDVAGTDDNAYQLINNLIALRTRETENADGRIEHKTGAWKGQIGKQVETIAQQYGNGNKGYVERKLRALYNEMDGMATEYGARSFVDESLRAARTAVREIYGSQEENQKRDDLKAFFGGRTIYLDKMVLDDAKMGEGGVKGLRSRFATVNLKVTTKQKDGAFHLESEWEEVARRFGLDPDISNPADQLMELDEMISNVSEYGGVKRALTADEDRILDLAALDLVSGWIMAGSTPVVQRTVTHIDQEHQQKALDRIDELETQVSEQADTIESQAQELADEKAKTRTVLDQLFKRAHELEELKRSGANRAELDEARKAYAELANEHAETVKQNKSLERKLEKAREKHRELHRELSEARKAEKEAESKAEKLQQRVEKQKARLEEKLYNQKQKLQEARAKGQEYARRYKAQEDIRKQGTKIQRMIVHPKPESYVPADMMRAVGEFIDEFLKTTRKGNLTATGAKLQQFMQEMRASNEYNTANVFDERTVNMMNQVNQLIGNGTSLSQMPTDTLQLIAQTLKTIVRDIETADLIIGEQRNLEIRAEATEGIKVMDANPRVMDGKKGPIYKAILSHLNPQRVFRAMAGYKENAISRLADMMSGGQRTKEKVQMEMTKFFEKLWGKGNEENYLRFIGKGNKKKGGDGWYDTGIDRLNSRGEKVGTYKITGAMKVSIALHWLNEQNKEGMKIAKGANTYQVTVPDEILYKKGEYKEAYARGTTMYFTESQGRALIDSLTDYEKQWIKAWQDCQAYVQPLINKTSMLLKGYRLATLKNYFPIHRDTNYIAADFESVVMDRSLENLGFTKARVNSHRPILLEDVVTVIEHQISANSDYIGMAIPVRNFNKIYNATMGNYSDSFKKAVYRTQGKAGADYIEKMMSDIQGGQRREKSFLDSMRSRYAGAVLGLNPSVTIKQAASFPTAAATLGWKPITKAMAMIPQLKKIDLDMIDKYTAAHWLRRSQSFTDAEGNAQIRSGFQRAGHKFFNSIQEMDIATTRLLWVAAEFAVQENSPNLKKGSEEYYQDVGRMYDRALEETQPEHGVWQTPQVLRSKNEAVRMLTMFKTQSFQNFGIMFDAGNEMIQAAKAAKRENTKENQEWLQSSRKRFALAASSQVVSGVVLAVMTMIGKALYHSMDPYRDEKGDITPESAGTQILRDTIGSWAGMFSGGSELYELILGVIDGQSPYDIEAAGISTLNDLYQNVFGFLNKATVLADSDLSAQEKWDKFGPAVRKLANSISEMFGIPMNNALKLIDGTATNALEIASGVGGSFQEKSALGRLGWLGVLLGASRGRDVSNTKVAPYIAGAMADGDQAEAVRLYNEQLRQGKSGQAVSTAIKTQQKAIFRGEIQAAAKAIEAGDVTTYNNLINQMTKGGVNMANAVSWVETERKKIGKAGAEENNESAKETAPIRLTYDEIMESLLPANAKSEQYTTGMLTSLQESGNLAEAQKVYQKLLETREASSIQSSMTSYWKPQLVSAYERGDMTEVKRIKSMLMQFGYKEKTIANWTKKKKTK